MRVGLEWFSRSTSEGWFCVSTGEGGSGTVLYEYQ